MEKTEMMKRYEEETGFTDAIVMVKIGFAKLYFPSLAYVQWFEEQFAKSEAKANISDEAIEAFQKIIRNQCDEISELKAQLTWRPVSEKPERMGMYLAEVRPYMGNVDVIVTTVYFNGESFLGYDDVVRWLPIPPAPE